MRPPPRPLRAVLFDWDGTLLDTAEASFRCYARTFPEFGIRFERDDFERTYSPDWYRTYDMVGLPRERWDEANARWLAHYACEPAGPIEGALEAVRRLREAGLRLGLVTSGSRERVDRELDALELSAVFSAVVCGGEARHRKPHPEGLHIALERLGAGPAESVYVGDSPEDVEMARAAGVYAVGIPGAFPNRDQLRAAAPELLAPDLAAAVDALLGLGRGRLT